MALQDAAMLVSLKLTQWTARKLDYQTTNEICDAKSADHGSGNFNKQIIPKKYLKNIQMLVNKIRNYHYQNTLAWNHKGADLLPSKNYFTYMERMGDMQEKFEGAVEEFLTNYPTIIKQVSNNLNQLYDETDYPTADQIRNKFHMQIDLTPVPSAGDFRIDINEKELTKIQDKLKQQLEEARLAAEQDLFSRLYTTVAKAVLTLRIPGKIFRNTLILNIEDICEKVPAMNVNNNKALNKIAKKVLKSCKHTDINALRDPEIPDYRRDTANYLNKLLERIEAIYLGANDDNELRQADTSTEDGESTQPPVDQATVLRSTGTQVAAG